MKKLILFPILLFLSACSYPNLHMMPNHLGVKPSYELDHQDGFKENIHKYKMEFGLDWNI